MIDVESLKLRRKASVHESNLSKLKISGDDGRASEGSLTRKS